MMRAGARDFLGKTAFSLLPAIVVPGVAEAGAGRMSPTQKDIGPQRARERGIAPERKGRYRHRFSKHA